MRDNNFWKNAVDILPPLCSQQIIFPCKMVSYLEINFFPTLTVDTKRPEKLVNDILHFICTLSTQRN